MYACHLPLASRKVYECSAFHVSRRYLRHTSRSILLLDTKHVEDQVWGGLTRVGKYGRLGIVGRRVARLCYYGHRSACLVVCRVVASHDDGPQNTRTEPFAMLQ